MLHQVEHPCAGLAQTLMHFMVLDLDGIDYHLPTGISPALILFVRGSVALAEEGGQAPAHPRFALKGPFHPPRHAVAAPGTLTLSVLFRPGMLRDALGIPPAQIVGQTIDMRNVVDGEKIDELFRAIDATDSIPDCLRIFQQYLLTILRPIPKKSVVHRFYATHHKIFAPLVDMALAFGTGQRQLERRVRETFGINMRDLRRAHRFGYCLQRLANSEAEWGDLTRIAHDSGYYDQAHMTREFLDMTGHTPLQLYRKAQSGDPAYWVYRIKGQDYDNLFNPVA